MRVARILLGLALVGSATAACFRPGTVPPPTGGHDFITQEELERVTDYSLYEAVAKLRPSFLKNRAITAQGRAARRPLMLYVDGEKMESVDDLRRFTPGEVQEVRFYEPHLANMYFGRYDNYGGAIAVVLKKIDVP